MTQEQEYHTADLCPLTEHVAAYPVRLGISQFVLCA
jgi:hypothetical protein